MRTSKFLLNESIPSINPAWYTEEADSPFFHFQWLSVGFHASLLILCFWIEIPKLVPEPIEIEILDSAAPNAIAKSVAPSGGSLKKNKVEVGLEKTEAPTKSIKKALAKIGGPGKAVASKVAQPLLAATSDDSEVNADELLTEIESSIDQVDQLNDDESDVTASNAAKAFASTAEALMEDSEIVTNEAKNQLTETQKLKDRQDAEARRKALAQEIAASRFAAQSAAQKASEAAAAQAAAEARAVAAAAASARKQAIVKAGENVGGGSNRPAGIGVGGSIRSLDQLKQQPGNKRPRYDIEDRMAGREGPVTLVAYVADSGNIQKLKMVQSSGHRTLDSKTVEAIKVWKFFPGQAGWVEIPIQWDLKGGPQEKPSQLRRKVTRN